MMRGVAIAQRLAPSLGKELNELGPGDGRRLAQILWRLELQVRRAPEDLETRVAYQLALLLAGRAQEARREALTAFGMLSPDAPSTTVLNVASALTDSGRPEPALQCLEQVRARNDATVAQLLRHNALLLALRFGRLAWFVERYGGDPLLDRIADKHLSRWWAGQQDALERALGERVGGLQVELVDYEDDSSRIVLTYYTDAEDPGELDRLQEAAGEALMVAYASHPEGPGAFLGKVVVEVKGPVIALGEPGS
jgi:tetratricopeptide (TPR) repeat protein